MQLHRRTITARLTAAALAVLLSATLLVAPLTDPAKASIGPIPTPCDLPRGDLVCYAVGIASCYSRLEALAQRLDRGAVTQVLVPLALLGADALALLLDVRHSRKCPLSRAARW